MEVHSAIELISNLVYKPGWSFEAIDHTNRFEGAIQVKINYPARDSKREDAPEFNTCINTYATFPMIVATCDDIELYRKIANALTSIEIHEMREFLKVRPTLWAPFHPHRVSGMKRWKKTAKCSDDAVAGDMQFGIA